MADKRVENRALSEEELQDLVSSSDAGARNPVGAVGTLLAVVAVVWSLFQVVLASPLSNYILPGDVVNNSRQVHLAFAVFLAFMAYPALKSSPRDHIPLQDWFMGLLGAFIALYGFFSIKRSSTPAALPMTWTNGSALAGLLILFEGARRALGPAMAIIATIFLGYVFFGSSEWVPDVIRWKGASLKKAMSHMWITSEGVFGIALGVSTKFVFLFVLFGALLDKAGAGNYFHQDGLWRLGPPQGGAGQGCGCRIGGHGPDFRFIHRQRCDHRHLHHPADEAGRLFVGKGRRGRGRVIRQRSDHAAGHGGCGVFDGGICRHFLCRGHHPRIPARDDLLYRAGLYRASGSGEEQHADAGQPRGVDGRDHRRHGRVLCGLCCLCYGVQYPVSWIVAAVPVCRAR